ncbi:MAG: hypothetical protein ACRDI2_06660, partial [Chloroflexota bacterium]
PTLSPALRPKFEIQLDSGKVTNFLAREIAPWVSEDPVDAEIQLTRTTAEVPNPAYRPPADGEPSSPGVSPTIRETRPVVGLRNDRDGRGPDYLGTFSAMQILFRSGSTVNPDERRVAVRLAPRPARVQDGDLARARDMANLLIGEPIVVRWENVTWTITRDELAGMLRYQSGSGGLTAYLTRDGLLAKAEAIARDLQGRPEAPKDAEGNTRSVDVPATASAIWLQASTAATNRVADVAFVPEAPPPQPPADEQA